MDHKEHIKRMAVEAGLVDSENAFGQLMIAHGPYNDELERFAQAVARECADLAIECRSDVVEESARRPVGEQPSRDYLQGVYGCGGLIDKEIRARFGLGE